MRLLHLTLFCGSILLSGCSDTQSALLPASPVSYTHSPLLENKIAVGTVSSSPFNYPAATNRGFKNALEASLKAESLLAPENTPSQYRLDVIQSYKEDMTFSSGDRFLTAHIVYSLVDNSRGEKQFEAAIDSSYESPGRGWAYGIFLTSGMDRAKQETDMYIKVVSANLTEFMNRLNAWQPTNKYH